MTEATTFADPAGQPIVPPVSAAAQGHQQPVAYVSGPYRDKRGAWYVEQNIRAAETVAVRLWQMGYAVVCPHTNTRMFDGAAPDNVWLDGDCEIVRRCDLLVILPTWARSQGGLQEMAAAAEAGVPVFHWEKDFAWLEEIGRVGRSVLGEAARAVKGRYVPAAAAGGPGRG